MNKLKRIRSTTICVCFCFQFCLMINLIKFIITLCIPYNRLGWCAPKQYGMIYLTKNDIMKQINILDIILCALACGCIFYKFMNKIKFIVPTQTKNGNMCIQNRFCADVAAEQQKIAQTVIHGEFIWITKASLSLDPLE